MRIARGRQGVDQVLTYNLADFERFDLEGIARRRPPSVLERFPCLRF